MPFIIIFFGLVLVLVGYNGTLSNLITLLKGDFTGSNNFIYWVLALFTIGLIGYVPKFKGFSDSFMILVLVSLVISNKGFFNNFITQVQNIPPMPTSTTTIGSPNITQPGTSTSGSGMFTLPPLTPFDKSIFNSINPFS